MRCPLSVVSLRLLLVLCCCCAGIASAAVTLEVDTPEAKAGYFVLSWDQEAPGYLLQQAPDERFAEYREWEIGPDAAFTVSGLAEGDYYYRIQPLDGEWSNTVVVNVRHHSLARAWTFFFIGLTLFAILAGVILFSSSSVNPSR